MARHGKTVRPDKTCDCGGSEGDPYFSFSLCTQLLVLHSHGGEQLTAGLDISAGFAAKSVPAHICFEQIDDWL